MIFHNSSGLCLLACLVVSASADVVVWYKNHRMAVWDTASDLGLLGFQVDDAIRTWRISPDARHVVVGTTTGTLYFWRLLDFKESTPATPSDG